MQLREKSKAINKAKEHSAYHEMIEAQLKLGLTGDHLTRHQLKRLELIDKKQDSDPSS